MRRETISDLMCHRIDLSVLSDRWRRWIRSRDQCLDIKLIKGVIRVVLTVEDSMIVTPDQLARLFDGRTQRRIEHRAVHFKDAAPTVQDGYARLKWLTHGQR